MQIKYNINPRGSSKIKYIVIHDTGNKSTGANARAHFNYFNGGNRNSSADCFIDDKEVLWINNYEKYYSWHCGDGKGKNGITNNNSIGIELCVNKDGDYNKAFNNLTEETARIAKELNIPLENIVRHFDASGKICPASMSGNNWEKWKQFKSEVKEKLKPSVNPIVEYTSINDIVWELNHRGIVEDTKGMIDEMQKNPNGRLYWLGRKTVHYIRSND